MLNLNVDLIFVYIEITFKCISFAIDLAWLVKVVLSCQGEIRLGSIVHQLRGNINGTICNFCGLLMKSGGITRFKFHLMHKDPHNNTKKCPRVPPEVKEEIRLLVHEKKKQKQRKMLILKTFVVNYVAQWGLIIHIW